MARAGIDPATPWRWLQQAVALLRAQPRALLGATSLLLAVALAPYVVQGALAAAAPGLAQVLSMLLSLLLYPLAVGGYYRVLHALAQGTPAAPSAIFSVLGDGPAVRRLIIANLILVSGAMLVMTLLFWAFGGEALVQFWREVQALQPGAKRLPALPPGSLPLVVASMLFGAALLSVQGLSFTELALGARPPLAAIGAALRLVGKHFGLLLLFYIPMSVFAFLAFMLVLLVSAMITLMVPALGSVLMLVMGLVLVLVMYALLFAFFYFAWRELLGEVAPPPPPLPTHEIAA